MSFGVGTKVTVEKSRAQLEALIRKHGGYNFGAGYIDQTNEGLVFFTIGTGEELRQIRLKIPLPFVHEFKPKNDNKNNRTPEQLWDRAVRGRWRLVILGVRAKLELIRAGMSTIDDEFLSGIAMPNGQTVKEVLHKAIGDAYRTGRMPMLVAGEPAPALAPIVEAELVEPT